MLYQNKDKYQPEIEEVRELIRQCFRTQNCQGQQPRLKNSLALIFLVNKRIPGYLKQENGLHCDALTSSFPCSFALTRVSLYRLTRIISVCISTFLIISIDSHICAKQEKLPAFLRNPASRQRAFSDYRLASFLVFSSFFK